MVELVNNAKDKKFINWVFREYQRQKESLNNLILKDYSLKYNLPNWIIDLLKIIPALKQYDSKSSSSVPLGSKF